MPGSSRVLDHSETFPVTPEHAFDAVLAEPLERIFDKRFWAIPAVTDRREQPETWGTPGQTRTIVLADGGTMQEELTEVRRPDQFGYRISDVTGPMKPLVASVEGTWAFTPEGAGTRITWTWVVHPRRLSGALMPIFGWLWRGNARNGFANLHRLLG